MGEGIDLLENHELRARSRRKLKEGCGNPVLAFVIYSIIVGLSGAIPYIVLVISIAIGGPMLLGLTYYYIKLNRDETTKLKDIFQGFKNYYSSLVSSLLYILIILFVLLCGLLLIVPGIIAGYRYAMSYYILSDNPYIGAKEALDRSIKLMFWYKMKLFKLDMSFVGWLLLCILTLGIGLIWLAPYWKLTRVNFYENLIRVRDYNSNAVVENAYPLDSAR